MTNPAQAFVSQLAAMHPQLQQALEVHRRDYEETLPHVFLGEVVRHVCEWERKGEMSAVAEVASAVNEAWASGAEEMRELVVVSFLENLLGDAALPAVKELLNADLQVLLASME